MSEPIGILASVTLQVNDLDEACEFYSNVMGFRIKLRDGDKRAEFETGTLTLSLLSRDHAPQSHCHGLIALNIKVPDVGRATERSLWGGAKLVEELNTTADESRSTIQDPSGWIINLYSPRR